MHPKDANGMANSVDPDQTAPGYTLLAQLGLHVSVQKSRIIIG